MSFGSQVCNVASTISQADKSDTGCPKRTVWNRSGHHIPIFEICKCNPKPNTSNCRQNPRNDKKDNNQKELKKLIPDNTIIPDGTEVARQRPQDSDARKNTYSGKKKRFTNNTTVITNKDGLIIQAGKTFEGGTHDLKMITDDPIDLGRWSRGMFKENTLKKDRLQVLADKGYQGLEKRYPGINLEMPTKKPPKGELTPQQKKRNKKSAVRG